MTKNEFSTGPCFSLFGTKTEIFYVNLCTRSHKGKIRTRRNFVWGYFSLSGGLISFIEKQIFHVFILHTVKAHSYDHNDSTTYPKVFQELGRMREIGRRVSVMKYILNKFADMLYLLELDYTIRFFS